MVRSTYRKIIDFEISMNGVHGHDRDCFSIPFDYLITNLQGSHAAPTISRSDLLTNCGDPIAV
jgi:hypothetical protein